MHHKNKFAISRYRNLPSCAVLSVAEQVPVEPCKVYIFGPQFSIFPVKSQLTELVNKQNAVYTQPSEWAADVWRNNKETEGITIHVLPFGVDTDRFTDIADNKRDSVMVYFKSRSGADLKHITDLLDRCDQSYTVFKYGSYREEDYLYFLQHHAKYGIIVDAHESQGFAIQEAMSCNVPLLVWNIKSMDQEFGSSYPKLYATSIPYWDNNLCGEVFYTACELQETYDRFISRLPKYNPRLYILENLSIKVCEQKLSDLINLMVVKILESVRLDE